MALALAILLAAGVAAGCRPTSHAPAGGLGAAATASGPGAAATSSSAAVSTPPTGAPANPSHRGRPATPPATPRPARAFAPGPDGVRAWAEQQAETLSRRGQVRTIVLTAIDPVDLWVAGDGLTAAQGGDVLDLLCRSFRTAFPGSQATLRLFQPYPQEIARRECRPEGG